MTDEGYQTRLRVQRALYWVMPLGVLAVAVLFTWLAPITNVTAATADFLFYGVAVATSLATAAAYMIQQRVPEHLVDARTAEEALDVVFSRSLLSLACLEASSLLALTALLVTDDPAFILFVAPFFVAIGLLYPTDRLLEQRIGPWILRKEADE